MKCNVVFVILHYNSIDSTKECIESIIKLQAKEKVGVVIVDNASPNGTGMQLEKIYRDYSNIKVILCTENVGFAKGNNIGYLYAKKELQADCIICANNDVYFTQRDFLEQLQPYLQESKADLLGPDIRSYHDSHQNPLRIQRLSWLSYYKKHIIKKIWLVYWNIKRIFPRLKIGELVRQKADSHNIHNRKYQNYREDVVLQGACIIFLKSFIEREDDAFVPDTFMYMEEDILSYKCAIREYNAVYDPTIYVFHAESLSTSQSFRKKIDKELFYYRECLNSDKVLHSYMKKYTKKEKGNLRHRYLKRGIFY